LGLAAKTGVVGAAAMAGVSAGVTPAGAATQELDDVPFDYANPANLGDWAPSRYGPGDQRGAFNEVTADKTARALRQLNPKRPVKTYNLGELMWNGFPALQSPPRRMYEQRLTIGGYPAPPNFQAEGGIVQFVEPAGINKLSVHEERFAAEVPPNHPVPLSTTYQLATQLDNLNHVGAAELFYNGLRGPDIARGFGTTKLGNEHMGPLVTRGVLLDVLGVKLAKGQTPDLAEPASNGKPLWREDYRITVEDIREAMDFGDIDRIEPGDVVLIRTGWNQLLARRDPNDLERWSAARGVPGIYLREARYLARYRPAIIGSDTWVLEVFGSPVNNDGAVIPVHQELLMRHGIRIGESYVLDGLADDRVYEFVYIVTPQFAQGATCGNTPPAALGQPRRR
jgi:kynurenine formamidase